MDISKGVSPWILSKNRTFSYRCFLQKLCQKRSFFDILERKQSFVDQNIEVLTRAKNGFCPKIELSLIAVFHRNYVRKDRFLIFLIQKKRFKTKK